jgi:hypothetical protein
MIVYTFTGRRFCPANDRAKKRRKLEELRLTVLFVNNPQVITNEFHQNFCEINPHSVHCVEIVANEFMQADARENVHIAHRARRKRFDTSLSLGVTVIDLRNFSVRGQYNTTAHHSRECCFAKVI